jgi:uracil-DNA glycosylase family 4
MPNPDEIAACSPYLDTQIKRVDPSIIVCLGALATRTLIDKNAKITRIRGEWHEKDGILYMPTFHPAALLRDPSKKRPVWEDMKKLNNIPVMHSYAAQGYCFPNGSRVVRSVDTIS